LIIHKLKRPREKGICYYDVKGYSLRFSIMKEMCVEVKQPVESELAFGRNLQFIGLFIRKKTCSGNQLQF